MNCNSNNELGNANGNVSTLRSNNDYTVERHLLSAMMKTLPLGKKLLTNQPY